MSGWFSFGLIGSAITLVEHERIILYYRDAGELDQDHALDVYQKSSANRPSYVAAV